MAVKTINSFRPADRYLYDFKLLTYARGWAQVDTKQDASYFGTWTNPERREIFTYCEGDRTLTTADTHEEYRAELLKLYEWNRDAGYWLGIDPVLNPEMTLRFEKLGFTDWNGFLH